MDRQKSATTLTRQKSAVSVRSNIGARSASTLSPRNARSAQTGRTSTQAGKGPQRGKPLDYPCSACESEGKTIEATNFCSDCAENLCADCVKQHQKFPAMKNHRILGKADRKRAGEATPAANPLECSIHPGKLVEMYCEDHDEIWCGACIAVHHRKCKNTMLLDKAAKEVLQSNDIQYIKDNLKSIRKSLMALKKRADTNLSKLEKQRTAVVNKIQAYRQKLNQALDKLEETTVKAIDQAVQRAKLYTEDDKKLYADTVSTLDAVLNMVVKTKGKDISEAAIFVGVKRARQKMVESERIINFTRNSAAQEILRFIPDIRLMAWIKSLKQLGDFAHQQRSYAGALIGKYNIHSQKDSTSCDVFGCDILPDGRLLLSDWDNQNVKLLDETYNVVDQCTLPGSPLAVCCINPETVVVSLTMEKTLQFVSITTTVSAGHTVATEENCRGLAYHDGQIFVLCGGFKSEGEGRISVYSTTGEPLNTIKTNNVNQRIFTSPISIAIDADGMFYHVTDGQRGVITMTPSNDVVSVVSCQDVAWPCGICMDREGNALICNGRSNNVIQMSTLSKFIKVLSHEDGVKSPRAVCFDPNRLRLIVTNRGNHIAVYQLVARGMPDIAKDVKATIPTVESTETTNTATSDPGKKATAGAKKSEPLKTNENVTKQNGNNENAEANKVEDNKVESMQEKKKGKGTEQKKTAAFTMMTEKLKQSQQTLKAATDVSTANTSPENGAKAGGKSGMQEMKETPVTARKPSSALPSTRQSREKSVISRQDSRQSNEDLKLNLSQTDHGNGEMATSRPSARRQSKDGLVTSTSENKPTIDSHPSARQSKDRSITSTSVNKPATDGANKSSKRPQTASTESTRRGSSQSSAAAAPTVKKTQTTVNSISLRSKEKETTNKTPKAASSVSTSLENDTKGSKQANAESVEKIPETVPNKSATEATIGNSEDQGNDTEKKTDEEVDKKSDHETAATANKTAKQEKGLKETLTKQNQKVNSSLKSLRSKVAPSSRPSTRDSTSTQSSRKTGRPVRKT